MSEKDTDSADKKTLEQELVGLMKESIKALKNKIKSGDYTASDMKNAIELLKNNSITCETKEGDIPDGMLADCPEFDGGPGLTLVKGE